MAFRSLLRGVQDYGNRHFAKFAEENNFADIMRRKYFHISFRCSLAALCVTLYALTASAAGREVLGLNTGWGFHRGDIADGNATLTDGRQWQAVTLPHTMRIEPKHCGGGNIYQGIGWYRRSFTLPRLKEGSIVKLRFEGVQTSCDVYLNGEKLLTHHGGYMGFTVDITRKVILRGSNLLVVRVSSEPDPLTPPGKPQEKLDFYYYGGIYRDVKMIITPPVYISDELEEEEVAGGGVFVTYPEVSPHSARVHVRTSVRNDADTGVAVSVRTTLIDPAGRKVRSVASPVYLRACGRTTVEQDIYVKEPRLWHPYHPDLYVLRSEVLSRGRRADSQERSIGIRRIEMTREGGFFINGEHLYLRGANRHQAFPFIGDAAPRSMQERDVIDMKKGGCNAVRAAHYPQSPDFLNACDRYGLLVIECVPGWQYYNKDSVFIRRLADVTRKMIRRDRNHPSVFLWETALNESFYPKETDSLLYSIAHSEYPGEGMYTAGDYLGREDRVNFFDVFYKQVKRYPANGDVMSNSLEDQADVKPLLCREWGDGVGEKPRVSRAEGENEMMRQCRSRFRQLNGEGYFDWCMLDANPRMAGHFLWSYNDYERGAERETMYSGMADADRWPKYSYYMMQSMRSPRISQKGLYSGPMVFVASSNSSPSAESAVRVHVFSNCDTVRLWRNGRLIGEKHRADLKDQYGNIIAKGGSPDYVFDTGNYEKGTLRAAGIMDGKEAALYSVTTPGKAAKVKISLREDGILPVADGRDLIPVYFRITDAEGNLVDTAEREIMIRVDGEGTLVGGGQARLKVSPQTTEGGIGFAFIRTTEQKGKIRISVSAPGLTGDAAEISTERSRERTLPSDGEEEYTGRDGDKGEESGAEGDATRGHALIKAEEVKASSYQTNYPPENAVDGNDFSWWIAAKGSEQSLTLRLEKRERISLARVRFQKDSSSYDHSIEVSDDGVHWDKVYSKVCTGWDFAPVKTDREAKYFRVVIHSCSEGMPGIAEVSLYR